LYVLFTYKGVECPVLDRRDIRALPKVKNRSEEASIERIPWASASL